jgi:hypothetical protein
LIAQVIDPRRESMDEEGQERGLLDKELAE